MLLSYQHSCLKGKTLSVAKQPTLMSEGKILSVAKQPTLMSEGKTLIVALIVNNKGLTSPVAR